MEFLKSRFLDFSFLSSTSSLLNISRYPSINYLDQLTSQCWLSANNSLSPSFDPLFHLTQLNNCIFEIRVLYELTLSLNGIQTNPIIFSKFPISSPALASFHIQYIPLDSSLISIGLHMTHLFLSPIIFHLHWDL